MAKWFGTNGVRGIVGDTMTPEVALRLGQAVGTWLQPGDRVVVGTDARASRDMLKNGFCAGLHSTGVHTVDVGILPSPGIQAYVRSDGFAAGGIITASHNPPEYNGIKLVAPDGTETSRDQEEAVEAILDSGEFRAVGWSEVGSHAEVDDAASLYVDSIVRQVDADAIRKAGFTVVLDPGGGAGCLTGQLLLEKLGVEVVGLSCDFDGAFRDRPSEPTPENAQACMDAVRSHGAHLGFVQDGDADRAVFIDENGHFVEGDVALAIAAREELHRAPPDAPRIVCTPVATGSCVRDVVEAAGGKVVWTVVGSPVVARRMIELGAPFGGEGNGGFLYARHQVCRDGLMAVAAMLELMVASGKSMSQLVAEIPRYHLVKDKMAVPEDVKDAVLVALRERAPSEAGVADVDDRDGVKCMMADGSWVLVRPSGTEPIYRVQAEARTPEEAQALASRFRMLVEGLVRATVPRAA